MADSNPFLHIEHPIAFDRMRAEHVRPAVAELLEEAEAALGALESDPAAPTYDNTLAALERVGERLDRAMTVIGHLETVATTAELRAAYNEVQPKVTAFYSKIPLSTPLFARIEAVAASAEARSLDPTRARFLDKTRKSFLREGAGLSEEAKRKLQALNVELAELTTRFGQNVLDATNAFELFVEDRAALAGLPERAVAAAARSAQERGRTGYRFTLQEPSLIPVLTYLDDASIRERVYRAYHGRASNGRFDNRPLLTRILELRREKARMLGYADFVDLVLSDRMAETGARAREFVDDLAARSRAQFVEENRALSEFRRRREGPDAPALSPWDIQYYSEKQRSELYAFDEEALRPYFPLERVLEGLFELSHRLYGIRVERADGLPVWADGVRAYRVLDADQSVLGIFYADLFPREQKRGGAWMHGMITGEAGASGWSPHVGLICANVTPPASNTPSLLGHREVETIFHEFGHLLHHLLSRVSVRSLAGTHVAWDFVELPSQIMENWCWERESLDLFARHYATDAPIPNELFERMQRARTYRGANAMMRQLGFATVDLELHSKYDPARDGDLLSYGRAVLAKFAPAPPPADYAMIASFGHLFSHPVGYAGGYYSYKWAEVLDADAFSRFKHEGLFSPEVGRAFRDSVLSRGDSRDPMTLFKEFMGREPDLRPLLERTGIAP